MIPPAIRTALLLLSSATFALSQVDDILANVRNLNHATIFKPKVTVSDRYTEKVVTEVVDDNVFRYQEPNPESIAVSVTANLADVDTGVIDASTIVGITAGYFDHSAALGEAGDYRPGLRRATFPLTKSVDLPNGDTRDVQVGSVVYIWTAATLNITVNCTDVAAASVGDVAASDYVAAAEVGTTNNILDDPIDVSVNFGDATGMRTVYLRGVTRTITKGFGLLAKGTYEEFDMSDVTIQGSADVTGPVVKPVFPVKPDLLNKLSVTGTADDITTVSIDSVTVNGIATPAIQGADDTGDGVWKWSVLNLPLKKGTSTVVIAYSDEDGNMTKITKAYTIK